MRLSSSPNAPALVAIGTDNEPRVSPIGTPGSISSTRRIPLTPNLDKSAAAVSPPVAEMPDDGYRDFESIGQTRNELGAKRHVGRPIVHDLDEDIAASGQSLLDVCSDGCALTMILAQYFRLDREIGHGPGRVQTKRGRPRSLGERADDGQYTEFAGRNAQWLNDLTGVEASQRMRRPALPIKTLAGEACRPASAVRCRSCSVSASQTATVLPSSANPTRMAFNWPLRTAGSETFSLRTPAVARTSTRSALG